MNPFEDAWRACLQAHFEFVVTTGDTLNESSLITVLVETGYSKADVIGWRKALIGEVADEFDVPPEPLTAEVEQDQQDQTELIMAATDLSFQPDHSEADAQPTLQDGLDAERSGALKAGAVAVVGDRADSFAIQPEALEQAFDQALAETESELVDEESLAAEAIDPPQQLSLF